MHKKENYYICENKEKMPLLFLTLTILLFAIEFAKVILYIMIKIKKKQLKPFKQKSIKNIAEKLKYHLIS